MESFCSFLANRLRRELVRRSCLNLILLLGGGINPPMLDSQGLRTSAVEHLGVLLVIGMVSQRFRAGPALGSETRPRVITRVSGR